MLRMLRILSVWGDSLSITTHSNERVKCAVICEEEVMDDVILHFCFCLHSAQVEELPIELVPMAESKITIVEDICQYG